MVAVAGLCILFPTNNITIMGRSAANPRIGAMVSDTTKARTPNIQFVLYSDDLTVMKNPSDSVVT